MKEAEAKANAVPPRPDTAGMARSDKIHAMTSYYKESKDRIIADFNALGEKKMLERWGIPSSSWLTIRARWMPDRFEPPNWRQTKKKDKKKASAPTTAAKANVGAVAIAAGVKVVGAMAAASMIASGETTLPPFDKEWPAETQVEWLRTLKALRQKKGHTIWKHLWEDKAFFLVLFIFSLLGLAFVCAALVEILT